MTSLLNWLDFDLTSARQWFVELGEKAYRGNQLIQAIHQQGLTDVKDLHLFSLDLRKPSCYARACVRPRFRGNK